MIFEIKYRVMFIVWFVLFNATFWTIDFTISDNICYNVVMLSINMISTGFMIGSSGLYLYLLRKGLIDV